MTKTEAGPLSLQHRLHPALQAQREEITHATALGRRAEVLEDICVQVLFEVEGIVPDWDDPRLNGLVAEANRHLD